MTYHIEKEFHFSASHQLSGLRDGHQCARLHGHNYILKVGLISEELNDVGFVMDYGDMGFMKDIANKLDHRHLNDIFTFNPTSENICAFYAERIADFIESRHPTAGWAHITHIKVSLSETPKTWAHVKLRVNANAGQ